MDDEVADLEKLIAALGGDPIPKLPASEYIDMVDEDNIEAEDSTPRIVALVENGLMSVDSLSDCQEDEQDGSTDKWLILNARLLSW